MSADEKVIIVDGAGALFVSEIVDRLVIEAIAIADGSSRAVMHVRHAELMRVARMLFGDDIQHHDPLGLTGGETVVPS